MDCVRHISATLKAKRSPNPASRRLIESAFCSPPDWDGGSGDRAALSWLKRTRPGWCGGRTGRRWFDNDLSVVVSAVRPVRIGFLRHFVAKPAAARVGAS